MTEPTRRPKRTGMFVGLLLTGMALAGFAAAQEFPEHPSREPRMVDIPETDNPELAARGALRQGQSSLKSAENALAKAAAIEGKKREKLERSAHRHYETAAEHFLLAIRYDQELVEAYLGLGEAWLATGQPENALQAWGAAQKRTPEDPEALFGIGRALVELDRPRDAASVYLTLAPKDSERATELLELLRGWGEPRAEDGEQEAQELLAWIQDQEGG